MSDETKLRACECGAGADFLSVVRLPNRGHRAQVCCDECDRCGPAAETPDAAISAWNARADDDLVTALVEALEKVNEQCGWRGSGEKDMDQFYCEHCGQTHVDSDLIDHDIDCIMTTVKAAIARAKQARGGGA